MVSAEEKAVGIGDDGRCQSTHPLSRSASGSTACFGGAGRSQTWLVQHARLSSSVVSRLIRGDRLPTPEHVAALAPLLGMSASEVVAGTDAETSISEASQYVTRAHFESVHSSLVDAESRIADLESELQRMHLALKQLEDSATSRQRELSAQLAQTEHRLERALSMLADCHRHRERTVDALSEAVTDVAVLQGKLTESSIAAEQGDRARLKAALSGWSGIGKRTAAEYLRKDR